MGWTSDEKFMKGGLHCATPDAGEEYVYDQHAASGGVHGVVFRDETRVINVAKRCNTFVPNIQGVYMQEFYHSHGVQRDGCVNLQCVYIQEC